MRKILNLSVILLLIFVWSYHIDADSKSQNIADKYLNIGNKFFGQEVYEEALENYILANRYSESAEINKKIIDSYIFLDKYDEVFSYLKTKKFNKEYIASVQKRLLNIILEKEQYKKYNKYINEVLVEVSKEFKNKNISTFIELKNQYTDIDYMPQDQKLFVVKITDKGDSWVVVNDKSKISTVSKFNKILGVDYPNITVQENKDTKIFDQAAKLKSKLNGVNYFKYSEGYYVLRENDKFQYINRAGIKKSKEYRYASNFNSGKAVVCNETCSLIDDSFNEIKKFKYSEVKSDSRNDAIHNEMIIFKKDNKYLIYDIKNKKISQEYDYIDYSMGDYVAVKNNSKWMYLDKEFNQIMDTEYDEAYSFSNGLAVIKQKKEYKIIDKSGDVKFNSEYKILTFNKEGISFINKNGKWTMIRLVRYIND